MNIPLIIGESFIKINERIREVINELEVKGSRFNESDQVIFKKCIERLEVLNNQIYTQVLGEFLSSMSVSVKDTQLTNEFEIKKVVSEIFQTISENFTKIDNQKHEEGFNLIKSLDNEDSLMELLKIISNPQNLQKLSENFNK